MKNEINYTLLTDGSSDRVLIKIINWLFNDLIPNIPIKGQFSDFSFLKKPPTISRLDLRIKAAIEYYPCDILFVHRDSENESREDRYEEIIRFWNKASLSNQKMIPIIPVRMSEAWLLIDQQAIKIAASNRYYKGNITLPNTQNLEREPDPKKLLFELIQQVSELTGRRLKKLNVHTARHIVAENIDNYSVLRNLSSFILFEEDVKKVIAEISL
ncbi:MAG: hypothetical protein NT007_03175 [Candidatus Kapabacteria bacterium]|nr:hypothetical protein [Candidatus Kapabacteria bacterium]